MFEMLSSSQSHLFPLWPERPTNIRARKVCTQVGCVERWHINSLTRELSELILSKMTAVTSFEFI